MVPPSVRRYTDTGIVFTFKPVRVYLCCRTLLLPSNPTTFKTGFFFLRSLQDVCWSSTL